MARALEEAGRHARRGGAPDAATELLELARTLTPPGDGLELLRRSVEAADYHFDAGDATRATALLHEAAAMARHGRGRARILFHLASISWLDMPRVQGLSEQALQEAGDAADIRGPIDPQRQTATRGALGQLAYGPAAAGPYAGRGRWERHG